MTEAPRPFVPRVVQAALLCAPAALALAFFDGRLGALPLAAFVACCLAAPFFPRAGFFLPVISHGSTGKPMVALTFDDGPDPATTPRLLDLLEKHHARAAFFVIGEKARSHPELLRNILGAGHGVGNHSFSHDVLLMLRPSKRVAAEIRRAQQALAAFGIRPLLFRPPAGITNPRLGPLLRKADLHCITFSCRGFDGGNRRVEGLAARILKKVRPDDIILLHDVAPPPPATAEQWLREIDSLLSGLCGKDLVAVPLDDLLGRPVMQRLPEKVT